MTGEEIEAMIVNKFVTEKPCLSITYYKADKSDLVKIDPPIDGQELFELLGNGSLYIYIPQPQLPAPPDSCSISMPVPSDSCSISTPVPSDSCSISMPVPSDSSSPISMAAPSDDCFIEADVCNICVTPTIAATSGRERVSYFRTWYTEHCLSRCLGSYVTTAGNYWHCKSTQ